jgi:translation initiation factor 2 subunit 2
MELSFGPKKKKKEKEVVVATFDYDYDYFELLQRITSTSLQQTQTDIKSELLKLPDLDVARDGTTKTVLNNFSKVCKRLNRDCDHVLNYIATELGTTASVSGDGTQKLILKGRYQQKQLESVIRHYSTEFVKCKNCGGYETNFKKENRFTFLDCKSCHSRRSIVIIKKAYVAPTKRVNTR